jgi:N-acetylglucosamine-6-sulfatase
VISKPIAFVLGCLVILAGSIAPASVAAGTTQPPNIVVFYIDDAPPHDGRLWNNATIAPTVKRLFVDHGTHFTNAIGETPLCCPGRGSLLTGQHTHNHGVLFNDGRLFNPGMHIGKALKNAGYATMFLGKYLNNVNAYSRADWTRDGAGWTYLDVINGRNGDFTKYWLHTKTGSTYVKTHSTRMVTERALMHFAQVPDDTPLFAVLSVFNMHGPNKPLPEYSNDARCNGFPSYMTPNYNEADVSDKPPVIQALPLLPYVNGWPMAKYCREMLGIDWMVKTVTDGLAAEGRLDNTLLVFTSDNGMAWGAHRAGQTKTLPYTTPVPLYLSFPARWGEEPRDINKLVVNIDLAPTFCDIAGNGCHLGPYPKGQAAPDGKSMLPLLDPGAPAPWRHAAIEQHAGGVLGNNGWRAIRTDAGHQLGPWHYVEWANGFRELYDLRPVSEGGDPWELQNSANDPTLASTKAALAVQLENLSREGRPASDVMRPDVLISNRREGVYVGSHIYASGPTTSQLIRYEHVPTTTTRSYFIQAINRSGGSGSMTFSATSSGSGTMTARYFHNGNDVTPTITGAGLTVANVRPGTHVDIVIKMTANAATIGDKRTVFLTARNSAATDRLDVVKAIMMR